MHCASVPVYRMYYVLWSVRVRKWRCCVLELIYDGPRTSYHGTVVVVFDYLARSAYSTPTYSDHTTHHL